jgi:hypothetical protein
MGRMSARLGRDHVICRRGNLRLIPFAALIAAAVLPGWSVGSEQNPAATIGGVLRVHQAVQLCRAHPAAQYRLWVDGWFVPAIGASGYMEGGLFDSRQAVPLVTVDQWDVGGHWKRYGALYVHIGTQASFGLRSLKLHGRLDCPSFRFWTDRDPFPAPRLRPVYGTTRQRPSGSIATWVTAGGLELTLTVPRRSYPRDALAPVRLSLKNVSRHDVEYQTAPGLVVGYTAPQPEVLDAAGHVVYPPAMPYFPALPGPAPGMVRLRPGQAMSQSQYIVVRGARIRASQSSGRRSGATYHCL